MHVQPLDGQWQLRHAKRRQWMPAVVPGNIHLDLVNAGYIPDPFVSDNELKVQWVAETDWTYMREFDLDRELLSYDKVFLECDGLDTLGEVCLNGSCIAVTDNMFIKHMIDVTGILRRGKNRVEIKLKSPVEHCRPFLTEPGNVVCAGDSIPGSPFMRKSPCQWGWDWGPKLPTSGVWRSVRLAGYNTARIDDLHIRQKHQKDGKVVVSVDCQLKRFSNTSLKATMLLAAPDGTTIEKHVDIKSGKDRGTVSVVVDDPKLWWPNGYGDQPLYTLEVVISCGGKSLHSITRSVGLRTLTLEQKKDKWGRSFTFVVNGKPIFCKGANWIPADSFPSRLSCEWYEDLVKSAAEANMNMLRVWGGGFYEDECFYDYCDKYGILVWHDFMFSCSHYPVDNPFIENVRKEIKENVRRIRHRACLALWCGNNEMEWFLAGGYPNGGNNEQHKLEHSLLFRDVIPKVVAEEDLDTPYWPSSPCSCTEFDSPNCEHEGDGHYWEVWHGRKPFTEYRKHYFRFMSEFGFQSLPCMNTVREYIDPMDWNMTSRVMEVHQKNGAGNGLILYYLSQTFRFPKDFESMVYVTQLLQAEAIRYGVEHWRRNRPRCMGTLYWQLNDCWPVASWSSIDYKRRWKALHYSAKRFYSPILLSAEETGSQVELHLTNDTLQPFSGTVKWSLEKLDGTQIQTGEKNVDIAPESSAKIVSVNFARQLKQDTIPHTVLAYELISDDRRMCLGLVPFTPSKHLELPEAKITFDTRKSKDGIELELKSDKTTRFVFLELPGQDIRFSDNYFDLPAGRTVTVQIDNPDVDVDDLRNRLVVKSLRESY